MAALATVTIVLLIVILPLTLIGALLVQEGLGVYEKIPVGGTQSRQVFSAGAWRATGLGKQRDRSLWPDKSWRVTGKTVYGHGAGRSVRCRQGLNIGQNTFDFIVNLGIVLYLLFFLLRDGDDLAGRIRTAIPLHADQQRELLTASPPLSAPRSRATSSSRSRKERSADWPSGF